MSRALFLRRNRSFYGRIGVHLLIFVFLFFFIPQHTVPLQQSSTLYFGFGLDVLVCPDQSIRFRSDGVYSSAHHHCTLSRSYNQITQARWRRPSSNLHLNQETEHGCCRMVAPSVLDIEEMSNHSCCHKRRMATKLKTKSRMRLSLSKSHFFGPSAKLGRSDCHKHLAGTSTSHTQ